MSVSEPASGATTPSEAKPRAPTTSWKADRLALVSDPRLTGRALAAALATQVDDWTRALARDLPMGIALAATAGYARRELCPGSDIDLCLIHDPRVDPSVFTSALWYPLWDAGLTTKPLTHTVESALALADTDLIMATTLLEVRHIAGDPALSAALAIRAQERWQAQAKRRLSELADTIDERHAKAGETAYLLEPDLKDGRGGLRDTHALRWAAASKFKPIADFDLAAPASTLFDARAELHRRTGRSGDRLLLQEQDGVADGLGYRDADVLMCSIADAARQISWTSDKAWRAIRSGLAGRRRGRVRKPILVAPDIELLNGEIHLRPSAAPATDPSLLPRLAALAAQWEAFFPDSTLAALAQAPTLPDPWTDDIRNAFLTLLGTGAAAVPVIETLDRVRLFERILPEWTAVRSKPQRNAFHRFTVDRHLVETAVNAAALVRHVSRPDLLLVGALLHDIGKGYPGDHTEVGEPIVRTITTRMGFAPVDVDTITLLERHHLLLAELATRRDIADPGTLDAVASALVDVDTIELLHALTQADSLATGPTAWTDWKAGLVRRLVHAASAVAEGHRPPETSDFPAPSHYQLLDQVRSDRRAREVAHGDVCTVAMPDRTGVFNLMAGVLSIHNVEVLSAAVWTAEDGIALEEFRIVRRLGGETNWRRVEGDLHRALDGALAIGPRLDEKVRAYAGTKHKATSALAPRAEVLIDNTISTVNTVIEVRAPDGPALLYRLTGALAREQIDIRTARVATLGHEVVDAFYVARLTDPERIEALRAALLASVDEREPELQ